MTKKRIMAIAILSPFLFSMGIIFLLVACIGYAINGKWEPRNIVNQFMEG